MTLAELREAIGKENIDKVTANRKVYLDMDRNCMSVGLPASALDGMRMKRSHKPNDYYSFRDLLRGTPAFFVSDGCFDSPFAKRGTTVELFVNIDDWEVDLSDKLEAEVNKIMDGVCV